LPELVRLNPYLSQLAAVCLLIDLEKKIHLLRMLEQSQAEAIPHRPLRTSSYNGKVETSIGANAYHECIQSYEAVKYSKFVTSDRFTNLRKFPCHVLTPETLHTLAGCPGKIEWRSHQRSSRSTFPPGLIVNRCPREHRASSQTIAEAHRHRPVDKLGSYKTTGQHDRSFGRYWSTLVSAVLEYITLTLASNP